MELVFMDFEVFKYDWLVVFMNPMSQETTTIVNNRDELIKFHEKHKNDIYCGYNVRHYDQYIFKSILCGLDPKEMNDWIIVKDQPGWKFSNLLNEVKINFFDVMTTNDSLKRLEGYMGYNIHETSVDFNINRKLTAKELAETIDYCRHDVEMTMEVFMEREDEFKAHMSMLKAFDLPLSEISKTKVQLSAKVLDAHMIGRDDEFDLVYPDTLILDKYKEVKYWYSNPLNRDYEKTLGTKKEPYMVAGVPHIFAWGGLHGARPNYIEEGEFLNVDVASYYPSLMIRYGFLSRNVVDPKKYEDIYHQRLKYKAEKNPLQAPLKIVLNGTYGAMKDKFNPMYDPRQANNVCIGGQLLLLDLIEKLEDHCDLIQSNTDGILVKLRGNRNEVECICREWMYRTGMVLEFEDYVKVIQRDVNNYIIVAADGSYKSKGIVVKKQNRLDYDTPILNEAVVNYFVKGIPVEDTINNCEELIKFQRVVKVSSKYDYAMHGSKRLSDKTLRVFASTNQHDGGVFKVKNGKNPEKFANTSFHCFIDNWDVLGIETPGYLDRQYYIDMANRHINQFLGKE